MDPIFIGIAILIVLVVGGVIVYLRRRSGGSMIDTSLGQPSGVPRPASRPAASEPDDAPPRDGSEPLPEAQDRKRDYEEPVPAGIPVPPPRQETDVLQMPSPAEEAVQPPPQQAPHPPVPQPAPVGGIQKEAEMEEAPPEPPKPSGEQWQSAAPPGEVVQFSAFHPKEVAPGRWYSLLFYVHLESVLAQIQKDAEKFRREMGGDPRRSASRQSATLARGTVLRIIPEGDGLEFNPPEVMLKWVEDYERVPFRFSASEDLLDQPAVGEIGIYTGLIEIARVRFAAFVTEDAPLPEEMPQDESDTEPQNALRAAELRSNTAGMYNKIFISYSRKDTPVAASYRLAQIAAGNDVFMDSESIRAGEDWQAALANAIRDADIFQLFWSEHTAQSLNCRDEWDYALQYKCPDDQCRGFIRPVYWRKPLHNPPPELGHLNFRYIPFEDEE